MVARLRISGLLVLREALRWWSVSRLSISRLAIWGLLLVLRVVSRLSIRLSDLLSSHNLLLHKAALFKGTSSSGCILLVSVRTTDSADGSKETASDDDTYDYPAKCC